MPAAAIRTPTHRIVRSQVQLTVAAVGQNLKYQWQLNGVPLLGAATDTLILTDIQPHQSGYYTVLVGGDSGVVESDSAAVAVRSLAPEPVILIPPESGYIARGNREKLTVYASGEEPLNYSWTRNGRPLPSTGPVLTLRNVKNNDTGIYRVTVFNDRGVAEAEADVQVLRGPTVRVSPAKRVARVGSTVVFRAIARGADPLEYQWMFNNIDLPGENGPQLVLSGIDESFSGLYAVRIVNPVGIASAGAKLQVRTGRK
jgi:hypothetical protein